MEGQHEVWPWWDFVANFGGVFFCCNCRYEGEWKDDMKWGFGKAVYRRKAHYEGHFFMDKRHGFGRMWYSNAGTYEVSCKNRHDRELGFDGGGRGVVRV